MLSRLRQDGIRRIVATSASSDDVRRLLERAGVLDAINDTVCAETSMPRSPIRNKSVRHAPLDSQSWPMRTGAVRRAFLASEVHLFKQAYLALL